MHLSSVAWGQGPSACLCQTWLQAWGEGAAADEPPPGSAVGEGRAACTAGRWGGDSGEGEASLMKRG